jgi:hypothetical protein
MMLEPPLADEGLSAGGLLARRGGDHIVVVGGDLVVQAFGRVRQQIPVLVDRTLLHRQAIPDGCNRAVEPTGSVDDEEFGPSQAAPDEIVEHAAPSLGALPTHALDRERHLLAVAATPVRAFGATKVAAVCTYRADVTADELIAIVTAHQDALSTAPAC